MAAPRDDSPNRLLEAVDIADQEGSDGSEVDVDGEDSDSDDGSGQSSNLPTAQNNNRFSSRPGQGNSVLPVGQNYVLNTPMNAPLSFQLTTTAAGGTQTRILVGNVNFTDRNSIKAANNYMRQRRARSRQAAGLPPLQPGRLHRAINATQHAWIRNEYHACGAAHNGQRMTNPELTRRFNAHWQEVPPRSEVSMSGYMSRHADLMAVRNQYTQQ